MQFVGDQTNTLLLKKALCRILDERDSIYEWIFNEVQ